jgi:hypothetical protein
MWVAALLGAGLFAMLHATVGGFDAEFVVSVMLEVWHSLKCAAARDRYGFRLAFIRLGPGPKLFLSVSAVRVHAPQRCFPLIRVGPRLGLADHRQLKEAAYLFLASGYLFC